MQRRTFLQLAALQAFRHAAPAALTASSNSPAPGAPEASTFGSGHFGRWVRDSFSEATFDLPAYQYTCNQTKDPRAYQPVNQAWRSPTDHIHQFGNDRVVAVASNYGYVQLRQDEGSPKFLNDYDPAQHHFGGGIGYLVDGAFVAGTHYPCGAAQSFERTFGIGYYCKQLRAGHYEIAQVIFAPFGDDPVLISQVTLSNRSSAPAQPRWIEYWGCQPYQFSYRSLMEASVVTNADETPRLRREFSRRFEPRFEVTPRKSGLLVHRHFLGRSAEEETLWRKLQDSLEKDPHGYFGGPVPPLASGSAMDDLTPPVTFLVSLDGAIDGLSTDATAFFRGGPADPAGAHAPFDNDLRAGSGEPALLLERRLQLAPNESRTLSFLYGYLPSGFSLESLLAKYSTEPGTLLAASSARWRAAKPTFRVEGEPWIEREITWNAGYLRSGLTYDSFFREHILSQGAGYQYLAGLQGAARDPLQHALPLIFTDPAIVRGILRYTLKEIQPGGSIPYAIVGAGVPMPCRYRPSDLELWLLWVASEYILATRDVAFLEERVSTYPSEAQTAAQTESAYSLLQRCFEHITQKIGTGVHGLQRLLNGDWNDSIVVNRLNAEQVAAVTAEGESVLNAAMASWVFDKYAQLLDYTGDRERAAKARAKAEAQRQAVRRQWNGRWFRRAWLGNDLGWAGEKQLWLEPQPWALLGGCATKEQASELVANIDRMSRRPSPIGALLQSPADTTMKDSAGTGTNGGIFAAINATLIWALAMTDGSAAWGDVAWDEWKKNTFALHAENYPDMWFGIWSGPDAYDSILARHPGSTAPDFPVLNMHSHAWPFYTASKLLGLEFHAQGLSLRPVLPKDAYEFRSPLFGLRKAAPAQYSGWYAPSRAGRWTINLTLAASERAGIKILRINGRAAEFTSAANTITFSGDSRQDEPLRWELH